MAENTRVPAMGQSRVQVVDPYGNLGSMDEKDAKDALQNGFRLPTPDELNSFQEKQQFGDGLGNQVKAGLAGAARSATFGLSDAAMTGSGLVDPKTLEGLKNQHPVTSTVGEIGGIAGMLLGAPEAIAGKVLGEGGAEAVSLMNPVKAVAKAGQVTTEAATPLAERAVSTLVNPSNHPIVSKILSQAGAHGLGSAVEGAAYGLGQSVSEASLGDPDMNAEKVLSNVGYSALLAGGMGGVFGAGKGAFDGVTGKRVAAAAATPAQALEEQGLMRSPELTEVEQTARYGAPGTDAEQPLLRDSVDLNHLDFQAKKTMMEALGVLKPNAPAIQEAAVNLGAPLPEGMVSGSEHIQRIENMLQTGPSPVAIKRQQLYAKGYEAAAKATSESLGGGADMSLAELGNKLKSDFSDAFEAKAGPVKDLYNAIDEYTPAIPVTEKSTGSIAKNILKIIEDEGLVPGTPEHSFVETFANGMENVNNLQKLKNFRTALGRATGKETRFVSSLIKEKLDNLEQNAIKRFASGMKSPEAKAKIMGLIDQIDEAKAGYRALREDMGKVGKNVLGRSKIYGPQDFLDAIDEQTPEKFAKKLFAKDNSEFLGWVNKNFPDQMKLIGQYQREAIREAAMKDGVLQPKAIFRQLDKLSPEVRGILFSPAELKRMEYARTYLEAMPKDFNPSHTSAMESYRRFFEHPIAATVESMKDAAALGFVKATVNTDSIKGLARIERMGQSVTLKIANGAKAVFQSGAPSVGVGYLSSKAAPDQKKKHEELRVAINDLSNNPQKFIDHMEDNTRGLYAIAPQLTGSVHQAAARATSFLSSKLPKAPPAKPLSPKFEASPAEVAKFNRYFEIVEDPAKAMHQLASNTLTHETVEALQAVYPKLYSSMQSSLMEQMSNYMAKNDAPIPYAKRMGLSLFLQQNLDDSLDSQNIQSNQATLSTLGLEQANNQMEQQARASTQGAGKVSLAHRILTPGQQVSQREA